LKHTRTGRNDGEEGRILNIERRGKKGRKEKTWKNP
jgi:hypothetical protein